MVPQRRIPPHPLSILLARNRIPLAQLRALALANRLGTRAQPGLTGRQRGNAVINQYTQNMHQSPWGPPLNIYHGLGSILHGRLPSREQMFDMGLLIPGGARPTLGGIGRVGMASHPLAMRAARQAPVAPFNPSG